MDDCCSGTSEHLEALWSRQARILCIVLAINVVMFAAEAVAGLLAASVALMADSLDMLGDSLVYGVSLFVIGRGQRARAGATMFKGSVMLVTGLSVLIELMRRTLHAELPNAHLMSGMGAIALVANCVCLALLTRHRADDINMRSSWICSRNDIVANLGVLIAAAGVYLASSMWPDVIIGLLITVLFLWSSARVLWQAGAEWRGLSDARNLGKPTTA